MNEKEYISELRELLTESAERITSSDSAILLSGGLDTSILASIIASINNEVPAFTVVTDGGTDLEYAQKIAEKFDVEHHVIRVSQKELFVQNTRGHQIAGEL
ncbi:MAG: asparagine synthase-related protein [Archaeoglobaceae archaeon]